MTPKKEYTVKELAKAIRRHPRTVYRWIYKNGMPCRKEKTPIQSEKQKRRLQPVYIIDFKEFMKWFNK